MVRRFLFLLVVVFQTSGCERVREAATVSPSVSFDAANTDIPVAIPPHGNCILRVVESGEDYYGDELLLSVKTEDGRPIAAHAFYSSYGKWRLDVIDLDADANPEFVLITGAGRGPGVRRETLTVLTLNKSQLQTRLTSTYSDWFGSGSHWQYDHKYMETSGGTLAVVMSLDHTPIGRGGREIPDLIPLDERRILTIGVAQLEHKR